MKAIADPNRRIMLRLLMAGEHSSGEIAAHFVMTRPAVSQHLKVLTEAGLATVRQQSTKRYYSARPEGLAELRRSLQEYWDVGLLRLAMAAENEERRNESVTRLSGEYLEREVRIAARPETVFAYFIDPEKMLQWKGKSVELDPRPGGIYRVDMTGKDIARGNYVEIVPHSRIVFTWGWEGEGHPIPPGSTTVEVTLTADGDETILRLRHYGLNEEGRASHTEGWEHYMERIVLAAAGKDPGPDPWANR